MAVSDAGGRCRCARPSLPTVERRGDLTDEVDGFVRGKCYLILDGDSRFTAEFRRTLEDSGIHVVRTAFQAPDMNADAQLERMDLVGLPRPSRRDQDRLEAAIPASTAPFRVG